MSVVRSPERDSPLGPDLSFLNGAVITQVFLHDHAAGLVFESDQRVYEWYVEEPLLLRSGGSISRLNPKVPISMAPLLSLLRRTVDACPTWWGAPTEPVSPATRSRTSSRRID